MSTPQETLPKPAAGPTPPNSDPSKRRLTQAIDKAGDPARLLSGLEPGRPLHLRDAVGSSKSVLASLLTDHVPGVLVITPAEEQAAHFAADLQNLSTAGVLFFPPTRRKPYDAEQVNDASALVQRSDILGQLAEGEPFIVCAPAEAVADKLISAEEFRRDTLTIEKGATLPPDELRRQLVDQGYKSVTMVDEPGTFAVRGGIFDIWSFGGDYPVRLEFFGDEVDNLREFDPDSQRSVAFVNQVRLLPSTLRHDRQTTPSDEDAEADLSPRAPHGADPADAPHGAGSADAPHGADPADAHDPGRAASLLDYLPDGTLVWIDQPELVADVFQSRFEEAEQAWEKQSENAKSRRLSPPGELFLNAEEFRHSLSDRLVIHSGELHLPAGGGSDRISLGTAPHPEFNSSFTRLREYIRESDAKGGRVTILCDSESQKSRFEELLDTEEDPLPVALALFSLHEGFVLRQDGVELAFLTDHQIFNRYHRARLKRKRVRGGLSLKELRDLNIGDFVVHVDYGIGRFEGFRKITVRNTQQESAVVRYRDDSILYVNVTSLHKLQKYSGKEGSVPQVTKLGSGEWQRKKEKTRKRIRDIARELIQLYAARKSRPAHAFSPDTPWQTQMEARFDFEETPDQLASILAVKADMESERPMDRLVCGDVGFGKTEVAVRAAFKAVLDQKQVAILVPTTILADQHHKTFTRRMRDFPVRVEVISRFVPPVKVKQILKELAEGKVDILIGTHRLVSKDVKFANLGLLVIDEEQRFGVAAKDRLKRFRATVDVLTLSATPIPRTLQFSLMGARDLSIIRTPPPNRQPVYTEIHSFNEELIREAIRHEVDRGGQVFFVHNRVRNIEEMADMLRQLLPDVRMQVAHGQMSASQLGKIIRDFYQHRYDVLLSTNIVENGIDIPNANTILINNAQAFGLSELHQLRGRVGRSDRKAFCYLITPPVSSLTPEARRRLMALEEFSDLGAGFNIAMRDLDIRGAGDLLGAEQSGFINDIGFDLYTKILNETVQDLKETEFSSLFESPAPATTGANGFVSGSGTGSASSDGETDKRTGARRTRKAASNAGSGDFGGSAIGAGRGGEQERDPLGVGVLSAAETTMDFDETALLESEHIADSMERINLYRKIASIETLDGFTEWEQEVTDRFGPLPATTRTLLTATRVKWYAAQWAIRKVTCGGGKIWLLAPEAETREGRWFYERGLFEDLVTRIQEDPSHPFTMSQKDGKLRLIVSNLPDLRATERFFEELYSARYGQPMPETAQVGSI